MGAAAPTCCFAGRSCARRDVCVGCIGLGLLSALELGSIGREDLLLGKGPEHSGRIGGAEDRQMGDQTRDRMGKRKGGKWTTRWNGSGFVMVKREEKKADTRFPDELCETCEKNPKEQPHTCPFGEEIHGSTETCTCCDDCQRECVMDI